MVGLPIGILGVLLIPPMQALDGASHMLRIDQISRGQIISPLSDERRAVVAPDDCLLSFIDHHRDRGWVDGPMSLRDSFRAPACVPSRPLDISNTAVNSPVAYLPQAVGYRIGRMLDGVVGAFFLARLFGLVAYIALCSAALRLGVRSRPVVFVIALMPAALGVASVLSADGVTLGLSLLAISLVDRLRSSRGAPDETDPRLLRRCLGVLGVVLVLLAVSKNLYAPFALVTLLVPASAFASKRGRWRYSLVVLTSSVGVAAAWATLVVSRIRIAFPPFGIDSFATRRWAGAHPLQFGASLWRGLWDPWFRDHTLPGFVEVLGKDRPMFGSGIWNVGDRAPLWLFFVAVGLVAFAVLSERGSRPAAPQAVLSGLAKRSADTCLLSPWVVVPVIVLVCTSLSFVGVRLSAEAVTSNTTRWVQGRYFLPLAPLAILLVRADREPSPRLRPWQWLIPLGSLLLIVWVAVRAVVVFY